MDLLGYSEEAFAKVRDEFKAFAPKLDLYDVTFIPISALNGDNVVEKSQNMKWYQGLPLLSHLEEVYVGSDNNLIDFRFPVQGVIRAKTGSTSDYRSYTGTILSGNVRVGDEVSVLPAEVTTRIKGIEAFGGSVSEAFAGMAVSLQLEDEVDISRGDVIAKSGNHPTCSANIDATVCWLNPAQSTEGSRFIFRHTTSEIKCVLEKIHYKININTLHRIEENQNIKVNDIAKVSLRMSKNAYFDSYKKNRLTGCGILIDEVTNQTVAAVLIL
jgi:sulfate adenylyltransferase subunit 1